MEAVVDVLIERNLGLNLEIKPCPGREKLTTEVALDLLSTIWDDHDRLLISSFQHVSLETSLEIAEDWYRGLLLPKEIPENWTEMVEYLHVSSVNINAKSVTREQVEEIMDMERLVFAYTVNEPDRARILQSWGVDGFFSDVPDVIKENILKLH